METQLLILKTDFKNCIDATNRLCEEFVHNSGNIPLPENPYPFLKMG
ncbi:MAG: hypothetical protein LWW85_12680 [Marinilabiliales bacterium]|nr:hypothetical protein [Marinilabiliales bacterium]